MSGPAAKGVVLILDDSLTVRMNLKEAFEGAGFATVPCATAAEAMAAARRGKIDLAVIDVQLPDADGISIIKEFKAAPATSDAAIIVLSSETQAADRGRGIAGGADEYVGKPYDISFLLAKADELLRAKAGKAAARARPVVLVIDDSATYREALKASLGQRGYDVETAENGEAGLKAAVRLRPDAVIVDGNMPGIDGATVVARLKSDVALQAIPCLLLTASQDAVSESRALDAGADSYARKDGDSADAESIAARLAAMLKSGRRSPQNAGAERGLLSPKRILAIDDSRTYLEAVAEPLREEGYDVITAMSGEEAIAILGVQKVDCVLLDRVMPGLSGQEVCSRIKAEPDWREIPLLMLTAHESREAMLESFGAGADDYVPKSSEFDVLKARVRAQLRRKQFEDEGRRIHEELARREAEASEARAHKELAETRAKLLNDLELANHELESFSYSVSHDLRAPLRAILAFTKILLDEHAATLSPEGRDYLQRVATGAAGMAQLVDGLLALASVSRSELKLEEVDLSAVVERVLGELKAANPARKVEAAVAAGVKGRGDPRLLYSLLQNLVSNAWKYSSKKTAPRIEFGVLAGKSPAVYFVRDNGAGFDMTYASKLFEPFQRLHSASEFEGAGIGLASVQRIIARHGGRIWAESKVGAGATFYFTLAPAAATS